MATAEAGTIYLALADLTGHGVPGSLLSVICQNALNDAKADRDEPAPSAVLDSMNERFAQFFGFGHCQELSDGMSISLCAFDPPQLALTFADPYQSIYIIEKGEVTRLKGDRITIGIGLPKSTQARYSDHRIPWAEGIMLYLFSDGFIDQFGGPEGRKYNSWPFHKLFASSSDIPIAHQHRMILSEFQNWRGALDQVDDVMALGIRVRRTMDTALDHAQQPDLGGSVPSAQLATAPSLCGMRSDGTCSSQASWW